MASVNLREIALDTLVEILEKGSFSHIVEKNVLDKYSYLEKNQRSYLTRLINGTIERAIFIDSVIDNYSKTKVKKMKPLIRTLLRQSVYEIYYMDSVGSHSTVDEAVKLAKKRGFVGLSGFVNGVLRAVIKGKDTYLPNNKSIEYSMPEWIYDMWVQDYGEKTADLICQGLFMPSKTSIRVNLSKISRDKFIESLINQNIEVEIDEELPECLYLRGFDSISNIDGYENGLFYVQDRASMLVSALSDIKPNFNVIDVCSAPGGKAIHAAEIIAAADGTGTVNSRDLTALKVDLINENIRRSGLQNIDSRVWDATVLDEQAIETADLVIADVPCSGLGVIKKKPDIKNRLKREDVYEIASIAEKILENASQYVKKGGTLTFSTCTINKTENQNQIKSFILKNSNFKIEKELQLFPNEKQDGFYICVMKKQ